SQIRNILLAGHAGSGKTTLAETMMFESGTTEKRGAIQTGTTLSDYHALEQEKQKSIYTSILNLDWRGTKINLIDTPGTPDFIGEVISGLSVADSALFLLHAERGVETVTEALWKRAEELNLPSLLAVNGMDEKRSDFQMCVDMAKERFGREVAVIQYPYVEGEDFHAIIDVLKMTMYEFPESGGRPDKLPIPKSHQAQVELLHNELVELIAENDESLMDLYFEHGELDEYQMRDGLQQSLLNRQIYPIFCISALRNMGSGRMMGFICNNTPSPLDASPVKTEDGSEFRSDPDGETRLFCFKSYSEAHLGNLTMFKVHSGQIRTGADLENRRDQSSQRIGTLSIPAGPKRTDVPEVKTGDLAVAVKLKEIQSGDTLTVKGDRVTFKPPRYPEPTIRKAILPVNEGEEDKLGTALHQLQIEDPSLTIEHSQELKQTLIHGQGEEHLSAILHQLVHRFQLHVEFERPKIPYRETITHSVKARYKHKKQSGGAGQFAEVHLLIEPWSEGMPDPDNVSIRQTEEVELPWGGRLVFLNCIVGGVIDTRFMPAILKGIMEKMENGPMSGCRVRDIRVAVFEGSMHTVDSNEAAFKTAALMAFRDGFLKASPQLMEPVYEIQVHVPADYMGDVLSDLSSRRGQIQGMDAEGTIQKIYASVPLEELDEYSTRLKSMTQGSATYTRRFSHYANVPKDIQERVMKENIELQDS
ncbi:MAG: elongation factor G, partial [Balneolaceae bacterium]